MSGIENGLVELAQAANDFWALEVVTAAAWFHAKAPGCVGFTFTTNGRAFCGHCGWEVSARARDPQLAVLALGRIGQAIAAAHRAAGVMLDHLGIHPDKDTMRLDGQGGALYMCHGFTCAFDFKSYEIGFEA